MNQDHCFWNCALLQELAQKYPQSKFVRIISTEAIPQYPDSNLPTVIVYKDKACG